MAVNGCSDFAIHGGAHNVVHGDQLFNSTTYTLDDPIDKVLDFVTAHSALNAIYNSEQRFPPPNCLPGTRTEILADCNRWIKDRQLKKRVFWIHGPAGVGKSAIMQNVSENHACKGKLLVGTQSPWHVCMRNGRRENTCHRFAASFFFSRNDPSRDRLDSLVATIVYQFLTSEPLREVLGPGITEAIRSNPGIFRLSFEDQLQKLILEPCLKVDPVKWKNLPNLVVIDGLDECILISSQERLIAMIREAIPACPLIFLLASRPEPRIHRAFDHDSFAPLLCRLTIGESFQSTRDITTFFHHRFSHLQDTHHALRRLDKAWPGEDAIRKLVKRACGQFIFAVTVMKYLESDDELPSERLEDILRIRAEDLPESPYPDLDLLYHQILATCPKWDEVYKILRVLLAPDYHFQLPKVLVVDKRAWSIARSPESIEVLLDLAPGKGESLLFRLHSVLEVPRDGGSIRILHASFSEYLLDSKRSRRYYVKRYTQSTFSDLLTRAFLRSIFAHSQAYHQDLSNSKPRLPARSDTLHISKDLISEKARVPLFTVFSLIDKVESPSDLLLAALDQLDPYPCMTWLLNWSTIYDRDNYFECWAKIIQWAESFGTRAPTNFLRRMESFISSFRIGSPYASIQSIGHAMAFLEQVLYIPKHLHIWCQLLGYEVYFQGNQDLYVLPIDYTPPSSWVVLEVTREKGNNITRLLESLVDCSSGRLIDDICHDTYNSVRHLHRAKYEDLYSLKKLVAQHRERFGLRPTYPCTPPSTIHFDSLDGEDDDPKADSRVRDVSNQHNSEQLTQKRKASPEPTSPNQKRIRRGT